MDKLDWFPIFDSLWISIHHIVENNLITIKLKKTKKYLEVLKNKIKEIIILNEALATKKGQKDFFNKKNKLIGKKFF